MAFIRLVARRFMRDGFRTACSKLEVVKWVRGFGREAECLAPGHIRERIRAEGEEMLARYV